MIIFNLIAIHIYSQSADAKVVEHNTAPQPVNRKGVSFAAPTRCALIYGKFDITLLDIISQNVQDNFFLIFFLLNRIIPISSYLNMARILIILYTCNVYWTM